jgi:hypothetical protein
MKARIFRNIVAVVALLAASAIFLDSPLARLWLFVFLVVFAIHYSRLIR